MNFSYSKLGSVDCPEKYKKRYIDFEKVEPLSINLFMGSRVHDTLECLYRGIMTGNKIISLKDLLTAYEDCWKRKFSEHVFIVGENYNPEHYKDLGRKCIESYYDRFSPFKQNEIAAVELGFEVHLNPGVEGEEYFLKGFIDRVDKVEDGVFEIHDYKTSSSVPSKAELSNNAQVRYYVFALKKVLAAKKVIPIWHYVAHDRHIEFDKLEIDEEEIRVEILNKIQDVLAMKVFPPNKTHLCAWCSYMGTCSAWR